MAGTEVVSLGTVVAGRYRVIEVLGRGGMGVVYRVEHAHTGEELALKVLLGTAQFDPQAVSRFKREARATARIRSDHVVRVTDADTAPELGDMPFIVMELLHGSDLERLVAERGPLPPAQLVAALTQVGRALEIAHGLGIVHRDLKPENLFLHRPPHGAPIAKVLDFGISKFVASEGIIETANMTSTGSVLGTPLYMAPEQAHGMNDAIAPTTDVWAMGLVALRLLTGESYWGMPTMADLMMKLVVKPMIAPSERWPNGKYMSPALDAWFARACAREQEKRFASVEQQMRELAEALGVDSEAAASARTLESLVPPLPVASGKLEDVALAATAPSDSAPPQTKTPIETVRERPSYVETTANAAPALTSTTRPPGRTTRLAAFGALAAAAIGGGWWALAQPGAHADLAIAAADAVPPPSVSVVVATESAATTSPSASSTGVDGGNSPLASARPNAPASTSAPVAVAPPPRPPPRRVAPSASAATAPSASASATSSGLYSPVAP